MKQNDTEKELIKFYDSDEWQRVPNYAEMKNKLEQAASRKLQKNSRINIRINSGTLEGIQFIALKEGLPYQTLISSVLHKYVTGKLKETK